MNTTFNKTMSNLRVLIVGASVAGPTAAYWFSKAGASVTVIERFPQLRTGGQNIDIRTIGVEVMRKVPGMEAAVRENAAPVDGLSIVRNNGRPYGTIRGTGNPDEQSLLSEYEIYRGDLSRLLVDMTKDNDNVRYVFGEQASSFNYKKGDDGPVTVEFANGEPPSEYDLVVACDGATSRTRALALGCGVREYIHPTNCWAAYYSAQKDFLHGSRIGLGFTAPRGRMLAIGPHASGLSRIVLMGVNQGSSNPAVLKFREALGRGDSAVKSFLAEHYRGAGWVSDEAIEHMLRSDDFYASEIVQVKPPRFYNGRIALVGDAGYAPGPTGTGTSLALAGAYVLAGEISAHGGDLAAGLRAYEDRMRPIVDECQVIPPFVHSIMAPQTAPGIWLRNTIFWVVCRLGIVDFVQKYFGGVFAAHKDKLPHYKF